MVADGQLARVGSSWQAALVVYGGGSGGAGVESAVREAGGRLQRQQQLGVDDAASAGGGRRQARAAACVARRAVCGVVSEDVRTCAEHAEGCRNRSVGRVEGVAHAAGAARRRCSPRPALGG
jgi:hypothetical protein